MRVTVKRPNLLQEKISPSDSEYRESRGNQTWKREGELAQEGDVEEREFFGGVAESTSKHGTDDGAKWPTETPDWHYDGLVRGVGNLTENALGDCDVP